MTEISDYFPEPYQATITFGDDSVINGSGSVDYDRTSLWLWPEGEYTFAQLVAIFDNPTKTAKITCKNSSMSEEIYFGYTFLADIKRVPDGRISVCMRKSNV